MLKENVHQYLQNNPQLQKLLFRRGYLLTSEDISAENRAPFYGNWEKIRIENYFLYVHNDQNYFIQEDNNKTYILVGHAYNPWDNISSENKILEVLIQSESINKDAFFEELSKVTGVFAIFRIQNNEIFAVQDSVGIMPVFYVDNLDKSNEVYVSSHSQLIADLCNLTMDDNIEKLVNSKFFLIGIRHLPGIKSPFRELKALTANTYLRIPNNSIERFYPQQKSNDKEYQNTMETICIVLRNSMNLIFEKFDASISLTGGIDSKMTLAATNGFYDQYKYFSFHSSVAEKRDAIAAHKICESMGLEHKIYVIPENNEDIKNFDLMLMILNHNSGYVKKYKDSEIRKIAYLFEQDEITLEVKSHVSEIARGFYYGKHGIKKMPNQLKPRHMSNFYKRNMFDRKTLKIMDDAFSEFTERTEFGKNFSKRYDQSDMFYWEHRMSQWAAFVKQDFDISHDTTIIYNNRKLLDTFMNFDLSDRINDIPQVNIIKALSRELYDLDISNENSMKKRSRILLERIFFEINSRLP